MELTVYLSGEIHTNWREEIIQKCEVLGLPIEFLSPVTNHELSDDVGIEILGKEDKKFWHDHKSAKINSIRTKNAIEQSDVVVVRFGEHQHALKEIDASASAIASTVDEVVKILSYSTTNKI